MREKDKELDLRHLLATFFMFCFLGFVGASEIHPENFFLFSFLAVATGAVGFVSLFFLNKKRQKQKKFIYEPFN